MTVKPIPDGYHTVTPYITAQDALKVIDFAKQAFGAVVTHEPLNRPDGKVMHAEVKIGDSRVMIGQENEMAKAAPVSLYLYFTDVDRVYKQAVKAGGKSVMEPTDMFYGDRCGAVKDPSGNTWTVATHKEELSRSEIERRAQKFFELHKTKAA